MVRHAVGKVRGMGISTPCSRARLLNPRTPARPDLKSGAVVLAWLPPRGSHRAIGITPFCVRFGEDPCFAGAFSAVTMEIGERIPSPETSFSLHSLRSRMRTRIVWLELSLILLDLSGSLQPVFVVIESAVGYGPGIAWAPTTTFGIQLRPYSVAAAVALSILSGLVFALAFHVIRRRQRVARAFPGPLLGFAVMCPACA